MSAVRAADRSPAAPVRGPHRPRAAPLKDLLRTSDLGPDGLLTLLDLAARFRRDPMAERRLLRDDTVVLFFNKPSTRTRISFETAVAHLGGTPLAVGPHELQLDRGETIEDTARVISSYARAFVIRTFRDGDVARFAAAASIPVVNALTDGHHPCQSVGDLLTVATLLGPPRGRRLAYVGDGNNVAHSLLEGCALLGMDVAVASPSGYAPDAEVAVRARALAASTGGRVTITDDPVAAVRDADAVYTDVWLSMGVADSERAARLRAFGRYRVDARLMARARPGAIFMHCLPAHRGEEVTAEVFDGPQSRVFEQAANRLPSEQAILAALVTGILSGH